MMNVDNLESAHTLFILMEDAASRKYKIDWKWQAILTQGFHEVENFGRVDV